MQMAAATGEHNLTQDASIAALNAVSQHDRRKRVKVAEDDIWPGPFPVC
jgi:hypothetical protein